MKKIAFMLTAMVASSAWAQQSCFTQTIAASAPTADYTVHQNGTVTDTTTNLMWQTCSLGQTFANGACDGAAKSYTWQEALDEAGKNEFAEYSDWRLPNVKELESLVEQACVNPSLNTSVIIATEARDYWTSTPDWLNADRAFAVEFNYGELRSVLKTASGGQIFVRLVRDAN